MNQGYRMERGVTVEQDAFRLIASERRTTLELAGLLGVSVPCAHSATQRLRAKGYIAGKRVFLGYVWMAVKMTAPPDKRGGRRRKSAATSANNCGSRPVVLQKWREGTPGEVARIPSLGEMLLAR